MRDAIHSGRLPRWLRVALVLSLVVLVGGIGLFTYRQTNQPKTLTIAAGSLDGYVPRFVSAVAARMAAANAPVRLKVIDKGKTLGVVGEEVNRNILSAISKEYDLDHAKVRIRDIAYADAAKVIQSKQ